MISQLGNPYCLDNDHRLPEVSLMFIYVEICLDHQFGDKDGSLMKGWIIFSAFREDREFRASLLKNCKNLT